VKYQQIKIRFDGFTKFWNVPTGYQVARSLELDKVVYIIGQDRLRPMAYGPHKIVNLNDGKQITLENTKGFSFYCHKSEILEPIEYNGIHPTGHYWKGAIAGQLCLDLQGIGYTTFDNKDQAVNWLYFNGFKDLAGVINREF